MSYGISWIRRKGMGLVEEEDLNVIFRMVLLGFLGRLLFKIVGSLRYKFLVVNLREYFGGGIFGRGGVGDEYRFLLGV